MTRSNAKLGVLTLTPDLGLGGGENRILAFSKVANKDRINHYVATVNEPHTKTEQELGSLRAEYEAAQIPLYTLGAIVRERRLKPWRPDHVVRKLVELYRVLSTFRSLIRDLEIDLIDAHGQDAAFIAFLVRFVSRVKLMVTLYHPGESFLQYWAGKFFLMRFDAIVTDSAAKKLDLKRWIVACPPVHVIYNGIDPPTSARSQREIEADLGIGGTNRDFTIGQVGRLVRFKGHVTLLHAAKIVLNRHPHAFFLLIGHASRDPSYRTELLELAQELGISNRVHVGGYPGPVGDVWRLIDIHVHASHFDSLPNAILEGMSFGKPAVVTDVGGITEMVLHESTGLVVPPQDPQAIANGLLRIIEHPQLAQELGQAAFERFNQTCRNDIIAEQIESLMERTVNQ